MCVYLSNSSSNSNHPIINSLYYRISKSRAYPWPQRMFLKAAVNLHKSYHLLFIYVVDVGLTKMTVHTRRAPNYVVLQAEPVGLK